MGTQNFYPHVTLSMATGRCWFCGLAGQSPVKVACAMHGHMTLINQHVSVC